MKKNYFLVFVLFSLSLFVFKVNAGPVDIEVEVGNNAPSFTVDAHENPTSDNATPTNVGANVTIQATATDPNTDDYYLLVCKTNGVPTPTSNGAPVCNGGSTNQLCVSIRAGDGGEATCVHEVTSAETVQTQEWYAFVCDYSTQSSCSSVNSGTGQSGTPYYINHSPTFSVAPIKPSNTPGLTFTWTVLSTSWGDVDNNTNPDTGKLLVCTTAGITGGACDGTELCASTQTPSGSALACTYDDGANPIKVSGDYDAYVYIVDSHNMPSGGSAQGTNVKYNIVDTTPVVRDIIINGGTNISLGSTEATTDITVNATIEEYNGCATLATNPVSLKMYRSGVGFASCTTNGPECYIIPTSSCSVDGTNTCTGGVDSTVKYNCTVPLEYYTDPTDAGSKYPSENWLARVAAYDNVNTGYLVGLTPVEVLSKNGVQMTGSIDYGTLGPKIESSLGIINIPVVITNIGNVGLDIELKGEQIGLCPDYPTCATDNIPHVNQKYEYVNNTKTYAAGTTTLTTSYVGVPLDIDKPTLASHPKIKSTYWGLKIPANQAYGSYTGANTINSVVSDPANW
jgi:hypothetical protein